MEYSEDDMLMLSGIKHFAFCKRQWALIHIFQAWSENSLTLEGAYLHRNADNPLKSADTAKKPRLTGCRFLQNLSGCTASAMSSN